MRLSAQYVATDERLREYSLLGGQRAMEVRVFLFRPSSFRVSFFSLSFLQRVERERQRRQVIDSTSARAYELRKLIVLFHREQSRFSVFIR